MREKKITFHERKGPCLTKQNMEKDPYEFPFTMNPYIGCFFSCKYCYLQGFPFRLHAEFGKEVKVKIWMPEKLDRELEKYRTLPQHLKRVQIGNATECYLPEVMSKVRRKLGRDLMAEILGVFRKHWNEDNRWTVHLVTKSHLIGRHLVILSEMKDQVQAEITLVCLDEKKRKEYERFSPSVGKRLRVIQELAQSGVFVRIMAMPLFCDREEALHLRDVAFEHGARAFKVKGLNYFDEKDVKKGNAVRKHKKDDFIDKDLLVNSGESVNGETTGVTMPDRKWKQFKTRKMPVLRSGYSELNQIDWGYLV